jgi:hypothetical protein
VGAGLDQMRRVDDEGPFTVHLVDALDARDLRPGGQGATLRISYAGGTPA